VDPTRRLLLAVATLAALTVLGTLGFVVVADLGFVDALYMAVTTLSTVGYGEVREFGPAQRLYAVVLILAGVGIAFYTLTALFGFLVEGRLRDLLGGRSMRRSIASLRDHVVICGYGRLGRAIAEELERAGTAFVFVDSDPGLRGLLEQLGHSYLIGSALDDVTLRDSGVERARALVAATASDADNVYVVLSARELNPQIVIHARGSTDAGLRRLRLAGAHQVVSPYQLGGQRIANAILRPAVVDFLELSVPGRGAEFDLEEVALAPGCAGDGVRLRELPGRGIRVSVVAIKRGEAPILVTPGPDDALRAGDRVVAVGDRENLHRLAALAEGPER
jgi:voltage-gated potassium channel